MDAAIQERIRQDKDLRNAYEKSRLAGGLLLKREGEELQRVHQYAEDLIKQEYRQSQSLSLLKCFSGSFSSTRIPTLDYFKNLNSASYQHPSAKSNSQIVAKG